jgi:hypothetical protein
MTTTKTLQNGKDTVKRLTSTYIMNEGWFVVEEENYKNSGWSRIHISGTRYFNNEKDCNEELNRRAEYLTSIGYK